MPDRPDPENPTESPTQRYRHDWNSAGAWAGRMAFPVIVLGVLLGMRAADALRGEQRESVVGYLLLGGCMGAIATGLWLLRVRHRHLRNMGRGEEL